jgi:PAS domain S-box-containing protein
METEGGATDGSAPGDDRASGVGQGLPWEDASVRGALLQILLDHFPAGIVLFDAEGRVRYVNPGARQHARRPPERLSLGQLSEAWGDLLDASGAVVPVEEWPASRALRGETVVRQEFHSRFLGSHLYPCLLTSVPLRAPANEIVGAVSISTFVTDATRIGDALAESLRYQRAIIAGLPVLVWSCTADGRCDYLSPQWQAYLGPDASAAAGWTDTVHPDDRDRVDDAWRSALSTEAELQCEGRLRHVGGAYRWFIIRGTPVRDGDGRLLRWFGTCGEIEDRKRFESELLRNRQFVRTVLDSLPANIAVVDRSGIILYVNRRWSQFAQENGAESDGGLGAGANYLDVCRRAAAEDSLAKTATDGLRSVLDGSHATFQLEYPCDSPEQHRWYMMTVVPFEGPEGGVIVAHSDITAHKEADLQLQAAYEQIRRLKEQLESENVYLREAATPKLRPGGLIGNSDAMRAVLEAAERVAATDSGVLILGETGTGKEMLARMIHGRSRHKERVMVTVNCAALPASLIESELFGREKGAYTGALSRQIGRFELADGSTLFLDEVGELPLDLQSKLLRVLEQGEFERVGSTRTIRVKVRIIAATNRDLEQAVAAGTFRKDLYYRLSVFPISLPPLRERKEDIPALVWSITEELGERMGKRITAIPRRTMEHLQAYAWPGNVRQLRNVIEHAMILSTGNSLPIQLPALPPERATAHAAETRGDRLAEAERRHILAVLERTKWRVRGPGGAAELLGLHEATLRARMRKLSIVRPTSGNH